MNKEDTKQAILGFTEFFKGITGNQDLKIPDDVAKEYGIGSKIGHWIPRNSFLLQYKCSECGWQSEKYKYCPNCGRRMFKPQESEGWRNE